MHMELNFFKNRASYNKILPQILNCFLLSNPELTKFT